MPDLLTYLKAWLGNADAQYRLALGHWANRDAKRTIYWARRAMENGAPDAFMLTTHVLLDRDCKKETMEGIVMIWRQAAEAGDAGGQFSLGRAYECGDFGVPRDLAEALRWYTQAALNGDDEATRAVARLCSAAGSGGAGKK
jgi:TPR repeat protein